MTEPATPPTDDMTPFLNHIAHASTAFGLDPADVDTKAAKIVDSLARSMHTIATHPSTPAMALRWLACGLAGVAAGLHVLADDAARREHEPVQAVTGQPLIWTGDSEVDMSRVAEAAELLNEQLASPADDQTDDSAQEQA